MIFDTLDHAATYFPQEWWRDAVTLLATAETLPDGEHPVRGPDVFMKLMTFTTVPEPAPITESHRLYADVHIVLAGRERIRVWPASMLPVREAYDEGRDVAFYQPTATSPVDLELMPGRFAALFPQDAHMPTLAVSSPEQIRKVVFKIAVTLLS